MASLKIPGFDKLTPEAQAIQLKSLEDEAEEAEQGCDVHWWCSVHRLTHLLTDEDKTSEQARFRLLTSSLMSPNPEDFINAVTCVEKEFPKFFDWMSWWLKPSIAQMTFTSQHRADPDTIAQTPKTSNAVEHLHQLLWQLF